MENKIALGTVQFGLDYGAYNEGGQVDSIEVKKIIDLSVAHGINTLDTASTYGNSEAVLGNIGIENFNIITKTSCLDNGVRRVVDDFYRSLERLNVDKVDGLLIHNFNDVIHPEFKVLLKYLKNLKQQGKIDKIGFSTYMPSQVDFLLDNFEFDLIQLPFNVFDYRLIKGNQLQKLKKYGVEIHARSIFLQGVLLNFTDISNYFLPWSEQFFEYQAVVKDMGLSLLEYALNFVLHTKEIDKILVGVDSYSQFREILKSIKTNNTLPPFPINELGLIDPREWTL